MNPLEVAHAPRPDGRDVIKCTTPLYNDGMVYVTGGYDTGGMMVKIGVDGRSAEVAWTLGDAGPFWAHPVIHNGILYLRHMNAMMAYNIKAK